MNEINELIKMLKSSDAVYVRTTFDEYSIIITDNVTANVLEDTLQRSDDQKNGFTNYNRGYC